MNDNDPFDLSIGSRIVMSNRVTETKEEWYKKTHTYPHGTRAKLLRRDGKGCVMCHSQLGLAIHHYYESRESRSGEKNPYHPDNHGNLDYLVLLCRSCHGKAHQDSARDSPFMDALHKVMEEKRKAHS